MTPKQKPGKSLQVFRTPDDFRAACRARFGQPFVFDFAADASNTVAPNYFTEADDALSQQRWDLQLGPDGIGWLNPPFSRIGPWAARCAETAAAGGNLVFLVPAAVGSNWFSQHVYRKAHVLFLNGRLHFMPDKPNWGYPKDMMLCLYGPRFTGYPQWAGFEVWRWKGKALPLGFDDPRFVTIEQEMAERKAEILRVGA